MQNDQNSSTTGRPGPDVSSHRSDRYWFDATTALKMRRCGPVGLTRVEVNTLRAALELPAEATSFCQFDQVTRTLQRIDRSTVADVVQDYGTNQPSTNHRRRSNPNAIQQIGRWIEQGFRRAIRNPVRRQIQSLRPQPDNPILQPGDSLVISGSTWDTIDPLWLAQLCETGGIQLVAVLADMIPWKFPHHFHDPVPVQRFLQFAEVLVKHATFVACISKATRDDFICFANQTDRYRDNAEVILLGADPPRCGRRPDNLPDDLLERGFVLSVSTIQIRKNFQLLYHVWRRFAEEGHRDLPRLLIVGAPGWLTGDLLDQLELDPLIGDHLLVRHDVDDAGLSWLYENCVATAYPSLYEGWGLPIVESLQHGKACLASNTSSMPEAGHGLAIHLDPYDFKAWHDTLFHWITDRGVVGNLEASIAESFKPRSWQTFGREFVGRVTGSSVLGEPSIAKPRRAAA